jgi:DNA-binding transcriptional ArsR family regulator
MAARHGSGQAREALVTLDRTDEILKELLRTGEVSVGDLVRQLNVSAATIRRALRSLERKGLLRRTHGGAVPLEHPLYEPFRHVSSFQEQEKQRVLEKRQIGLAAADLVADGDTIAIGASWFNRNAFDTPTGAGDPNKAFGDAPRYFADLRNPGVNNFDFSLQKDVRIPGSDIRRFQFRADFFNLFNRAQFAEPISDPGNANFGRITRTSLPNRVVQLGLHVFF